MNTQVHPRACGEHAAGARDLTEDAGSSPRVRGTPVSGLPALTSSRFIPARAGNTKASPPPACRTTVHPRACGEHLGEMFRTLARPGSSPRVRGTPRAGHRHLGGRRFIPARAGNTFRGQFWPRILPVHPRACGEHRGNRLACRVEAGSSPRVRGTLQPRPNDPALSGFIPARAGNTRKRIGMIGKREVHPRACGEHASYAADGNPGTGSSPRVRGTLCNFPSPVPIGRFIPARAGNTGLTPTRLARRAVHPRACGEHIVYVVNFVTSFGSSPRVRGTPRQRRAGRDRRRFIPARAGNTFSFLVERNVPPGSSPRVRGTPDLPLGYGGYTRFIPARAGNTF